MHINVIIKIIINTTTTTIIGIIISITNINAICRWNLRWECAFAVWQILGTWRLPNCIHILWISVNIYKILFHITQFKFDIRCLRWLLVDHLTFGDNIFLNWLFYSKMYFHPPRKAGTLTHFFPLRVEKRGTRHNQDITPDRNPDLSPGGLLLIIISNIQTPQWSQLVISMIPFCVLWCSYDICRVYYRAQLSAYTANSWDGIRVHCVCRLLLDRK